ncbi:MAG: hypothetical protein AAF202_11770 [Pseudomonadota bacterium]
MTELSLLRRFIVGLLIVLSGLSHAQDPPVEQDKAVTEAIEELGRWGAGNQFHNYNNALAGARATGKIIAILMVYDGCGFCPSLLAEMRDLMSPMNGPLKKSAEEVALAEELKSKFTILPIHIGGKKQVGDENKFVFHDSAIQALESLAESVGTDRGEALEWRELSGGFPGLLFIDPSQPGRMVSVNTGELELEQALWTTSGRYHEREAVQKVLQSMQMPKSACGSETE